MENARRGDSIIDAQTKPYIGGTQNTVLKSAVATVTSKGQVTIPVEIRRHLCIDARDKVEFTIDQYGCVRVERVKYPTLASLRGVAGTLKEPRSWNEIEEMVREERADAVVKKLRG